MSDNDTIDDSNTFDNNHYRRSDSTQPYPKSKASIFETLLIDDGLKEYLDETTEGKKFKNPYWNNEKFEKYKFPLSLQFLYNTLDCWDKAQPLYDENDKGYRWTLMPFCEVERFQNNYGECDEYMGCAVDFAYHYLGMGHVCVASFFPDKQLIYLRHDGGANGWEQSHHFEVACRFVPSNDELHSLEFFYKMLVSEARCDEYGRPNSLPYAEPSKELEKKCWDIIKARANW